MKEAELYFARQNFLWNLGLYFLIALGLFVIITFIIGEIYEWWRWRRKN